MILKVLVDYYQRLADDPSVDIAPPGFELKIIDFIIVLDSEGVFVELRDIHDGTGKKRKGRISKVPKAVKRSAGIAANLLWDTAPYVLGRALPEKGQNIEKLSGRAVEQHKAFKNRIKDLFSQSEDLGIQSVLKFLELGRFDPVFRHPIWGDLKENGGNISFQLIGDSQLICQRPEVVKVILEKGKPKGTVQTCSVTGIMDVPAKLHSAIKGVWGAQSSGANIVSFNLGAFRSFGKEQGYNAPVGQQAEFAYTTALNHLLASERQRIQVGDASTVFWAKNACDFEMDFYSFIGQPKKDEAFVSYEKIRGLLTAVKSGIPPEEAYQQFFVLGLAPNASRIAIRFWYDGNIKEIKERIADHFRDIEMIHTSYDPDFLSLFQLLLSTATENKADNIPPNLGGEVFRAIMAGTTYPRSLLTNAVLRCKAEQKITFARASIIKGFLFRNARIIKSNKQEVSMALDKTYDNIGYVLGRLFAVLERIQEQAQGGNLNKTIRDTYFGAASSSPLVVFRRLDDLAIHHMAKIRNSGKSSIWLDKMLGEIKDIIPKEGYPSILVLEDQGRFSIGYYHQRQDFFNKQETEELGGDE